MSAEFTFDEPLRATVDSVIGTDDGYVAIGSGFLRGANGSALQAWRSDDGFAWNQIHLTELTDPTRDERMVELVDSPHGLLAWTSALVRTSVEGNWFPGSFLRSSDDGGRTWTEHTGGPWGVRGTRVARPHVVGSVVLVTATEEEAPTGVGEVTLWRSNDLEHWEQLTLPDSSDDGWIQVGAVDEQTYLGTIIDTSTYERRWYLSTDAGASFDEVSPPHPDRPADILGAVNGRFVVTFDQAQAEYDHEEESQLGPVLATSSDGREWEIEDRNSGLWGDGHPRVDIPAPAGDPLYVPFGRTIRHDIRYCIADFPSCRQDEVAIAVTDGEDPTRELLIDMPTVELIAAPRIARSAESLLLWVPGVDEPDDPFSVQAYRWDDLGPEHLHRPAPLEPPSEPDAPAYAMSRDVVPVGERFHTKLSVGGSCSGDRFRQDDRWYVMSGDGWWPYLEDDPLTWPFQPFVGEHGPLGYLFVEGERVDADTFRFFLDDDETFEYRYDPDGEPTTPC